MNSLTLSNEIFKVSASKHDNLEQILRARVYDVAMESPLMFAPTMSTKLKVCFLSSSPFLFLCPFHLPTNWLKIASLYF